MVTTYVITMTLNMFEGHNKREDIDPKLVLFMLSPAPQPRDRRSRSRQGEIALATKSYCCV